MKKIFWAYLIIMGLILVWRVPPFQKADEVVHLQTAASIAGGRFAVIEKRFISLPERLKVNDVAFKAEKKFDSSRVWEKDNDKELTPYAYYQNWKSYIVYFPFEIGVWLGSKSDYPVMALYGGRMAGLIVFLIFVWVSMKIIPKKYRGLIMAYALIPMVLHQVTEVSYDVFLLCLAPLILAVFLRCLKTKNFWRWMAILLVLLWLGNSVKMGYTAIILLLPIGLWNRYKDEVFKRIWLIPIFFVLLVPLLIKVIPTMGGYFGGDYNLAYGPYQYQILKRDPGQILKIVGDTWEAKRDFYLRGMIGYFGWLDYEYDFYQYLLITGTLAILVLGVIKKIKKPIIGWVEWIGVGGIIVGTYLMIEMGFLSQWTPVGMTIVEGVQGRYLLPLVPLLFFWISQFAALVGKKRAKWIVFGLVCITIIWGTIGKIDERYYDNTANFKSPDELVKKIDEANKLKKEIGYISSKDKMALQFHTSDGDVLGGLEMVIKKNEGDKIRVPYRYSIKDKECTREIRWGYLNSDQIKNKDVYVEKIKPLNVGYNDLCLEIEPIVKSDKEKYFDFEEVDGEKLIRLLFISNEVN